MKIGLVGCGIHGLVFSFLTKQALPTASIIAFEKSDSFKRKNDQVICLTEDTVKNLRERRVPNFLTEPSKVPHMYDTAGQEIAEPPFFPLHLTTKNIMLESIMNETDLDLRLSSRVVKMDQERGCIELQSGEEHSFDLVVVADGYNSIARKVVHHLGLNTLSFGAWSNMRIDRPFEFHGEGWTRVNVFPFQGMTYVRMILPWSTLKKTNEQIANFTFFQVKAALHGFPHFIQGILNQIDQEHFFEDPAYPVTPKGLSKCASGKFVLLGEACHRLGDIHFLSCNPGFDDALLLSKMISSGDLSLDQYSEQRKADISKWREMMKACELNLSGENSGFFSTMLPQGMRNKRWNAQYG